jgi:RNA polymerase sigma-70 factor (ECF subfamily)
VLELYSRHLEDEISAEVCAEMERHIEGCARCRQSCDSLKRTLALCKATPAPHVPAAVQQSVRVALQDFLSPRG